MFLSSPEKKYNVVIEMLIYILYPKFNKDIRYCGSTTKSLVERKRNHQSAVNQRNSHLYQYIKNNGGMKNFEMEVFEEFEGNETDLKKREGEIIKEFKQNPELYILNKRIEGQTSQEYYLQNREQKIEKAKQYYLKNKDAVSNKKKEYYQQNKERIKQHNLQHYYLKKNSTSNENQP